MLLSRIRFCHLSTLKKPIGQPGIIVDPQSFRQIGLISKGLHWFKNIQTYNDMERHLSDFHRKKSHTFFVQHNNKLLEAMEKRNFPDLEMMLSAEYFKVVKNHLKNNEPMPTNYNLFQSTNAKLMQARSFMDTIVRLKSIDQWYQVVVEFENNEEKKKTYHVLERFYKHKQWKFIKFNL